MKKEFIEGVHYYMENGMIVFTEKYLLERGYCCNKKCRHCPFDPEHKKGEKKLKKPC